MKIDRRWHNFDLINHVKSFSYLSNASVAAYILRISSRLSPCLCSMKSAAHITYYSACISLWGLSLSQLFIVCLSVVLRGCEEGLILWKSYTPILRDYTEFRQTDLFCYHSICENNSYKSTYEHYINTNI